MFYVTAMDACFSFTLLQFVLLWACVHMNAYEYMYTKGILMPFLFDFLSFCPLVPASLFLC